MAYHTAEQSRLGQQYATELGSLRQQLAVEAQQREQYTSRDLIDAQSWRNAARDQRSRFFIKLLFAGGVAYIVPMALWLLLRGRAPATARVAA